MVFGLGLAVVGAILGFSRGVFTSGFTDTKVVLISAGVFIAWFFRNENDDRPYDWELIRRMGVYLLLLIPSMFIGPRLRFNFFGLPMVYSGSLFTAIMCVAGAFLATRLTDRQKGVIMTLIKAAGVVSVLICLAQVANHDPFNFKPLPEGRAIGLSGSPIDMSGIFVAIFSFYPNPLLLLGIWATRSRGAWLGAAVALLPVKWRIHGFVLATAVGLAGALHSTLPKDVARWEMWRVAIPQCATWLGNGPFTFFETFNVARSPEFAKAMPTYRQAFTHNAIVEAGFCRGIVGLASLWCFFVAPEVAGIWTVLMFNPLAFEVIFLVCVLVGLHRRNKGVVTCD
jgi:hypothetical protein